MKIELCGPNTYVHSDSKLYQKGVQYDLSDEAAADLLKVRGDQGEPFFKRSAAAAVQSTAQAPADKPKPVEGVVTLPEGMRKGDTAAVAQQPSTTTPVEPSKEAPVKKGGVKIVKKDPNAVRKEARAAAILSGDGDTGAAQVAAETKAQEDPGVSV